MITHLLVATLLGCSIITEFDAPSPLPDRQIHRTSAGTWRGVAVDGTTYVFEPETSTAFAIGVGSGAVLVTPSGQVAMARRHGEWWTVTPLGTLAGDGTTDIDPHQYRVSGLSWDQELEEMAQMFDLLSQCKEPE